jgi:hypothetical protein
MRITSKSNLKALDVHAAEQVAQEHGQDIYIVELATSPRGAITFYCESVNGKRSVNRRDRSGGKAASWTAWGWLIAELFRRDSNAHVGHYKGVEDFIRACREMHEWHKKFGGSRPIGYDIGFLELVD